MDIHLNKYPLVLDQRERQYKFLLSIAPNREQVDIHLDERPLVLDLIAENNQT